MGSSLDYQIFSLTRQLRVGRTIAIVGAVMAAPLVIALLDIMLIHNHRGPDPGAPAITFAAIIVLLWWPGAIAGGILGFLGMVYYGLARDRLAALRHEKKTGKKPDSGPPYFDDL